MEHLVSDYSTKPDALKHLEQALFGHEDIRPVPQAGAVELFRASSPRAEVEWAAARTLRLARDSGLRFRDIGVVARNLRGLSGPDREHLPPVRHPPCSPPPCRTSWKSPCWPW